MKWAAVSWMGTNVLAAASDPGSTVDVITPFLNAGLVGVLLIMFVLRKGIVPEWTLRNAEQRHAKEIDAKDEDIKELKELVRANHEQYQKEVIPAFIRSIDVNREYVDLIRRGLVGNSPPRATDSG